MIRGKKNNEKFSDHYCKTLSINFDFWKNALRRMEKPDDRYHIQDLLIKFSGKGSFHRPSESVHREAIRKGCVHRPSEMQ